MERVIVTLTGQKGGVGKSTVAICLAAELVERGCSVLLVDADPQGTVRTWGEVAAENANRVPSIVAMGAAMHKPGQLDKIAKGYDIVVIDSPPRHGDIQRSALMVADLAILPCGPSAADAWALATSLEIVTEARTVRSLLEPCILITRKQGRTVLGKTAREALAESALPVLQTELGYRIAYQEALGAGQGVTTYAPKDAATDEIRALVDELIAFAEKKGLRWLTRNPSLPCESHQIQQSLPTVS
jgi:chromosome partitioning protein